MLEQAESFVDVFRVVFLELGPHATVVLDLVAVVVDQSVQVLIALHGVATDVIQFRELVCADVGGELVGGEELLELVHDDDSRVKGVVVDQGLC